MSSPAHEQLHAVLWMQTAAEFRGLTIQTYRQATDMLDTALADPSWTASVEQLEAEDDFGLLPPAVILDVDETVLDNSAYQARLIVDGENYSTDTWIDWCRKQTAPAVAGALEFTRYAHEQGVEVFYVTNRTHIVEQETRENLERVGFTIASDIDTVLTRGEQPEWTSSDKTPRRSHLAKSYRILLLIGDNFGDFLGGIETSLERRLALMEAHRARWGRHWIVLPNPQYGSWESAVVGEYSRSPTEALEQKRRSLRHR